MKDAHRQNWVDLARSIGIVLVVYGHVARGLVAAGLVQEKHGIFQALDSAIYSFHMPLFFFLSGLFFSEAAQRQGTTRTVAGRVDRIAYPYVIWSLLQGMIEVAMSGAGNGHVTVMEVLAFPWHPRAQFWFLFALLQISVLAAPIYANVRGRGTALVALGFAAAYLLQSHLALNALTVFVVNYGVYFALGAWSRGWLGVLQAPSPIILLVSALAFLSGQLCISLGLSAADSFQPALNLAIACAAIFFICLFCIRFAASAYPWMHLPGRESMAIYLMHVLAASGVRVLLLKLGEQTLAYHLIAGVTIGLLAPMVIAMAIRGNRFEALVIPPARLSFRRLLGVQQQ